MQSETTVLLRLWNPSQLDGAFPAHRLRRLADGTVTLRVARPFRELCAAAPSEATAAIRQALGPIADAVKDQRGVFVFPDACGAEAPTYEEMLGKVGPAGFWVATDEDGDAAPRSATQFSRSGWRVAPPRA